MSKQRTEFVPPSVADPDWRKRPRKDRRALRMRRLSVRVTETEYDAICERAKAANLSLSDWVVARSLVRRTRLHVEYANGDE